jgi:hypothetical protein
MTEIIIILNFGLIFYNHRNNKNNSQDAYSS